jgi:hypothetical protein
MAGFWGMTDGKFSTLPGLYSDLFRETVLGLGIDDVVAGIVIPKIDPGKGSVKPSAIDVDPEVTNEVFDSPTDTSDPIRLTWTKTVCWLIEDGFLLNTFRGGFTFSGDIPDPTVVFTGADPKPKPDDKFEGVLGLTLEAGSDAAVIDGRGSLGAFGVCSSRGRSVLYAPFVIRAVFDLGMADEDEVGILDFESGRFADVFDLTLFDRADDCSIGATSGRLGGLKWELYEAMLSPVFVWPAKATPNKGTRVEYYEQARVLLIVITSRRKSVMLISTILYVLR